MKCMGLWLFLSAMLGCSSAYRNEHDPRGNGSGELRASAEIANIRGEKIGTATFAQEMDGVHIHMEVSRLTPGVHAVHIHNAADCHGPDFKSAGPHFNPYGKKHGFRNPDGPHAGDLPNFEADTDGSASVDMVAPLVTLQDGENSLFQQGGTSIVIHARADDYMSDPAGNSGDRVACGPIERN